MIEDTKQGTHNVPEVRYNLRSLKDKNKATLISAVFRYRIGKDSQRLVYSTKNRIEPKNWDPKKHGPRSSYPLYYDLKGELDKIEKAIKEIYTSDRTISIPEFKNKLDVALGRTEVVKTDNRTLIGYIKDYIERREKLQDKSYRTIQKYKTIYGRLIKYRDTTGESVEFEDMNKAFKENYLYWLYNNTKVNSRNTANKEFSTLKHLLREAREDGINTNIDFESKRFNVKRVKTSKITLTDDEVELLENLDLSDRPNYEVIKNWFLVACYSSLRWSDFSELEIKNFIMIDNNLCIHLWTEKTETETYIPVSNKLQTILEKYDYTSPNVSSKHFNETIKEICKMAGITNIVSYKADVNGKSVQMESPKYKLISSHHGRRFWATHHYLKGYPIALLMQVTGHTKESTFMTYIGRSKKDQAKALLMEMKRKANEQDKGNVIPISKRI